MTKLRLLLLAGFIFAVSSAHAFEDVQVSQLVDHLGCSFQYVPLEGPVAESSADFHIQRQMTTPQPGATYLLTTGAAKHTQEVVAVDGAVTDKLTFDFDIGYQHALKTDAAGSITAARQTTCVAVSARVCNGEGPAQRCNWQIKSCAFAADPFDAHYGWAAVAVENGAADFDKSALRPLSYPVNNRADKKIGDVKVTCEYLGRD